MSAKLTRACLVLAGLGALAHGCSGESRSGDGAGDAGATALAGSSGASEADAGEAETSASGSPGRGGAGGSAGSGNGAAGDASESGGTAGVSASGGAGAGGTAGSHAGTGGSGGIPADECDSNEDCPPIECLVPPCPESVCGLGSLGYRVCQARDPLPVGNCAETAAEPCCATSDDCQDAPGGHCVPFSFGYCGGPAPPDYSLCRYDTCDSDADCSAGEHGVCLIDYPRTCNYGPCRESADCTQGANGRCVMTRAGQPCPELVVFCLYDDDPCQSDADCPAVDGVRQVCVPDTDGHGRRCTPWQPPPP